MIFITASHSFLIKNWFPIKLAKYLENSYGYKWKKTQLTQDNDRSSAISHLLILSAADLDHGLGGRVLYLNLQEKVSDKAVNQGAQEQTT